MNKILRKSAKKPIITKQKIIPWLFVLPPMIGAAVFRYYPIFHAIYMSLFDYNPINPPGNFVGFENYKNVLLQSTFWQAWANTFIFLGLTIGLVFFIPLIQAIFLNELGKKQKFFTPLYLISAIIPISINVIIWKWVWQPDYGIANAILHVFGLSSKTWLSDPALTKFCIVFPGTFGGATAIGAGTGLSILLYLAAIKNIPEKIYEAAMLDGCSGWDKIRYITLPNIQFIVLIQLVLTTIATMQMLDLPYQFTSGGPSGASTTLGVFIYNTVQQEYNYGKANAAAVIVFLIIAVMVLIQLKLDNSKS